MIKVSEKVLFEGHLFSGLLLSFSFPFFLSFLGGAFDHFGI